MSNPASRGSIPAARPTCSIPGCSRPARTRGWCGAHYERWRKTGSLDIQRRAPRPQGLTKAEVVAWEIDQATRDGDCMLTTAAKTSQGYGRIRFEGRTVLLHRLALEVRLGRELTPDEQANHGCNRPGCINPECLYPGSHQDNMRDRADAGTVAHQTGESNGNAKLSEADVAEIRARYAAGGVTQEKLGAEYGVTQSAVGQIVRGETRRWQTLDQS